MFEVHGKSQTYRVDFGSSTGMPSCTCRDWQNYHIPCKHFFGVFQNKEDWTWDKLPDAYLKSEYLSLDGSALTKYLSTASGGTGAKFTSACTHSIASPSLEEFDKTLPVGSDFDELPKKVVYMTILSCFYIVTIHENTVNKQFLISTGTEVSAGTSNGCLDCIKTLTYNCGEQNYKVLEQVNDDLKQITATLQKQLLESEGLLVRPQLNSESW